MYMTLAQMRDQVESHLMDATNSVWPAAEIDQAIRHAFYAVASLFPRRLVTAMDDVDGQREYAITTINALVDVTGVHWPYTQAAPEHPPNVAPWTRISDGLIRLEGADPPRGTSKLRIFYIARHTLSGLDSDTASTLPEALEQVVVQGAVAYCCLAKAADTIGEINTSLDTPAQWRALGELHLGHYRQLLAVALQHDTAAATLRGWPTDKWDVPQG